MIHKIENKNYYLNEDDSIFEEIGIQEINGKKYFFNEDNSISELTGVQPVADKKYYFENDNTIADKVGVQDIDGKKYLFNEDNSIFDQIGSHTKEGMHFVVNNDFSITMQTAKVKSVEKISNYSEIPVVDGVDLKAECKHNKIELTAISKFNSISSLVDVNYATIDSSPELINEKLNRNIEKEYLEIIPIELYTNAKLSVICTPLNKAEVNYKTSTVSYHGNLRIAGVLNSELTDGGIYRLHVYRGGFGGPLLLSDVSIQINVINPIEIPLNYNIRFDQRMTLQLLRNSNEVSIRYIVKAPPTITTSFNIWSLEEESSLKPLVNVTELLDGTQQLVHQVDIDPEQLEYEFVVGFDEASNLGSTLYKVTLEYENTE